MTKKKKIILVATLATLLVTFILSGIGFIYVQYNLATYSVYYAKHMPHAKGTNPEMVFILDNLDFMGESTIKGVHFNTDGNNTIIKEGALSLKQGAYLDSAKYEISMQTDVGKEMYRLYFFDEEGEFVSYHYRDKNERKEIYEETSIRKKEAQAYVDEVITPIVDKMAVKPQINLQWLFNRKYQKRFSE